MVTSSNIDILKTLKVKSNLKNSRYKFQKNKQS